MSDDSTDKTRKEFFNTIDKIEEDLEKKITYISAGALGLSITFIEKIVDLDHAQKFWLLIFGWILLTITLSLNLIASFVSRSLNIKSLKDFDSGVTHVVLYQKISKRNNVIGTIDFISLVSLLLGILSIIIFCSVNLDNHKKQETMPEKDLIEKGRMIQPINPNPSQPAPSNPAPTPTVQQTPPPTQTQQ